MDEVCLRNDYSIDTMKKAGEKLYTHMKTNFRLNQYTVKQQYIIMHGKSSVCIRTIFDTCGHRLGSRLELLFSDDIEG